MNIENQSDDYKRGVRDGIRWVHEMDDEIAIMDVILGSKPIDELSQKQLDRMGPETVAKIKAQSK